MNTYIYQAALYCDDCAETIRKDLKPADDSDAYPQGPYPNGGGEADTPQHCDGCELFLENDLTDDGHNYVLESVAHHISDPKHGRAEILDQWIEAYDIDLKQILEHVRGES